MFMHPLPSQAIHLSFQTLPLLSQTMRRLVSFLIRQHPLLLLLLFNTSSSINNNSVPLRFMALATFKIQPLRSLCLLCLYYKPLHHKCIAQFTVALEDGLMLIHLIHPAPTFINNQITMPLQLHHPLS